MFLALGRGPPRVNRMGENNNEPEKHRLFQYFRAGLHPKVKLPSGSESKNILRPQNNGKKIFKI